MAGNTKMAIEATFSGYVWRIRSGVLLNSVYAAAIKRLPSAPPRTTPTPTPNGPT